jgi:AcrR family transcriptional regulator
MSAAPSRQANNRLDRRKARTRAALIRAAQTLIAEGRTDVPILEITQEADVGLGSFYNHFETKEQLFDAAVEAVMDAYGELLDHLTADIEDPVEVFACSFRLTGRLNRREPELSRVLLNDALRLLSADNGLAPRARRDIAAAVTAGRFDVADLDVAVTMAAGALIALGQLLHDQPDRDVEETTDRITEDLLRMFGLSPRQAHRICSRPLPDLDAVGGDAQRLEQAKPGESPVPRTTPRTSAPRNAATPAQDSG